MIHIFIAACMLYTCSPSFTVGVSPDGVLSQQILPAKTIPSYIEEYQRTTSDKAKQQAEESPIDFVKELAKLGYNAEETSDKNLNTRNAILRFQANHNMYVDGIFGELSLRTLKKRLKDSNYKYTDTVAAPPSIGKWILINKSKRILTLYENKTVIKKYPIAVGNPSTLTPQGKFNIVVKTVNPSWGGGGYSEPIEGGAPNNPLGSRWMGLSPNGGNTYGIHGNISPYSIGTDASHGCIRMIGSDVEALYGIVPNGIPVWICTDDTLAKWGITQKDYLSVDLIP